MSFRMQIPGIERRMSAGKRMLLFVVVGPFLGFVMGFWVMLPLFTIALGDRPEVSFDQLGILPLAYFIGAAPALLTGAIDYQLARRSWRPVGTTLAGYLLGFIPILGGLLMGFMHGPLILLFGLIGAVPALICSMMVSVIERR